MFNSRQRNLLTEISKSSRIYECYLEQIYTEEREINQPAVFIKNLFYSKSLKYIV
jgi:hypothetical protein